MVNGAALHGDSESRLGKMAFGAQNKLVTKCSNQTLEIGGGVGTIHCALACDFIRLQRTRKRGGRLDVCETGDFWSARRK